jgi:pyruvate, water dikinase
MGEAVWGLTLGVDRDSEWVAFDFDDRDLGVKTMLAVEGCKRTGRHSGLCGQAPSGYPDMAEYLVGLGVDSISLNPDAVLRTTHIVLDAEWRLGGLPARPTRLCSLESSIDGPCEINPGPARAGS